MRNNKVRRCKKYYVHDNCDYVSMENIQSLMKKITGEKYTSTV